MLFVSKFAAYRHVISPGSMRWVRDPSGAERQVDNGDFFWAEFKLGGLTPAQQDIAIQEFTKINPIHPFGALPHQHDGTINQMDAASEGETGNAHEGYMVYQRLSRFDTEDGRMCPERWRDATEECLLASPDFGRDMLRIDQAELELPWATYAEMTPDEVVAFATAGGFDIDKIIRYEKGTQKRTEYGRALLKAQKEQAARKTESEALTVIS